MGFTTSIFSVKVGATKCCSADREFERIFWGYIKDDVGSYFHFMQSPFSGIHDFIKSCFQYNIHPYLHQAICIVHISKRFLLCFCPISCRLFYIHIEIIRENLVYV